MFTILLLLISTAKFMEVAGKSPTSACDFYIALSELCICINNIAISKAVMKSVPKSENDNYLESNVETKLEDPESPQRCQDGFYFPRLLGVQKPVVKFVRGADSNWGENIIVEHDKEENGATKQRVEKI